MFDRSNVEIHSSDVVYDGFFQMHKLHLSHARFAGGSVEITRELFVRGEAVCVLLYDPAKASVVMIEQFRVGALEHPRSPWLLELVAGIVEQGETCEEVAHREADEEAGAILTELVPITRYLVSPGGTNEWISLYCARVDSTDMGGVHGLETEGEDIRVQVLPCKQVFEMVADGRIDNAPSIIALQWLQLNGDNLNQRWLT